MERMRVTAPKYTVGCTLDAGQNDKTEILVYTVNVCFYQGGTYMRSKTIFALALAAAALLLLVVAGASAQGTLPPNEELGKKLFLDTNLSPPSGLACAGCHGSQVGYTGPDAAINAAGAVYEGAVAGRFGNRKPPTAA